MKTKYLYINTIGCQMNVYDSERMAGGLKSLKYKMTKSIHLADLIIVNTCAIREKAEQKVFSFLGRLAGLKRKTPNLIIGVGGCVAQQEGAHILERMPFLDFVFGTDAIGRLPHIINQIETKGCRIVDVEISDGVDEFTPGAYAQDSEKVTSFVTIMRGCDNYCTYCVVPYVRGREKSREPDNIIKEIKGLVESGVREVTLLGQNVNSYGKKDGMCSFPELLSLVNQIDGLLRIRFTTSHPKDLSDDLIESFRKLEKLCKHIHLPVQSGSNRVLKRMNRRYTREQYLDKVDTLRSMCPAIAITSDIIVGFPGETTADFEETLDLIERVKYDNIYMFKYSDRPNTSATRFSDKILEQEKRGRLQNLLDLQKNTTMQKNEALVGSTELILVEGLSKKQSKLDEQIEDKDVQFLGRTSTNKVVNFIRDDKNFPHAEIVKGKIVRVRIEKALSHSLRGKLVKDEPVSSGLKGGETFAV